MMTPYMIVSFHTPDPIYTRHAAECIKTLNRWDLVYDIEKVPPVGSWVENCAFKPQFIQRKLKQYASRGVLWLDVDARVVQRPTIFDRLTFDDHIAVHYRAGVELLSNTIFFSNSPTSQAIVDRWVKEQKKNPKIWDQKVLQYVLKKMNVTPYMLPAEYAAIDFMRVANPVIVQTQASREVRKAGRKR